MMWLKVKYISINGKNHKHRPYPFYYCFHGSVLSDHQDPERIPGESVEARG